MHLHVNKLRIYAHLVFNCLIHAFIVASEKVVYCVDYKPRQYIIVALPSSRKVGCICRRV